jgi:hypothetical protein
VIKGWDEGVVQMSCGETAVLNITSDFGYGAQGAGADIPPNADLVFEVELVAINGKRAFYTAEEKEKFKSKMEDWRDTQLAKYDSKESFKAKKDEKYGDRDKFEAFLNEKVDADVATVKTRDE